MPGQYKKPVTEGLWQSPDECFQRSLFSDLEEELGQESVIHWEFDFVVPPPHS